MLVYRNGLFEKTGFIEPYDWCREEKIVWNYSV